MRTGRRRVWWLVIVVLIDAVIVFWPRWRYRSIVIHHTASEVGDVASIRRAHWARGWFEVAYHLVLSNGSVDTPAGVLQPTRRYTLGWWSVATRSPRHNFTAVHLVVVGNFEASSPEPDLRVALGHAVAALQAKHGVPDQRVVLHRECSATLCPGRFITRDQIQEWVRASAATTPAAIRAQHRRVLGRSWLGGLVLLGAHLALALWLLRGSARPTDNAPVGIAPIESQPSSAPQTPTSSPLRTSASSSKARAVVSKGMS